MGKATKISIIYLASLLVFSIIFSALNFYKIFIPFFGGNTIELRPMMLVTVIGGIVALKLTVSARALKIFLLIYSCLWLIRYLVLYIALHTGEINIFGRIFHLDLIVPGYYRTVSRLETPLPFVTFWLINRLFVQNKKFQDA
jgi:hypothetical protein